jgi:hypothetical protein
LDRCFCIVKSTQTNIHYQAFFDNKGQKPSWQNMGIMATAQNEYGLKALMSLKISDHLLQEGLKKFNQ